MATRNSSTSAPTPGKSGRMVAVDIGPSAVRVVEVITSGDDTRIAKRGTATLPADVWENLAANRDILAQAIKSALSTASITTSQVVVGLPRRLVTLKYARLPHAEPEQIRGMVQFEAQQYIPFPIEDVVLDHQIVSEDTEELTTVIIVAARLSMVNDLLSAFDKAGLEVTKLSVSALALGEHSYGTTVPTAIVDVDGGQMDMAVVHAGKLLFTRAASVDAETMGAADGQRIAAEVARSISAYQNEYRTHPVGSILVAGSIEAVALLEKNLAGLLDAPVTRLNNKLLPATDPESLQYATAAGLALEGIGNGISDINLVPQSRIEKKAAAKQRTGVFVGAFAAIALALVIGWFGLQTAKAQAKERTEAQRENSRLDSANSALTRSKTIHDKLTKTYTLVSTGLGRQKPLVDILKAVSDSIPKASGIHLTQVTFERGANLAIHGSALSESTATDLLVTMQANGSFREVRLNYLGDAQAEGGGGVPMPSDKKSKSAPSTSFLITCKVVGADQKLKVDTTKPTSAGSSTSTTSAQTDKAVQQ